MSETQSAFVYYTAMAFGWTFYTITVLYQSVSNFFYDNQWIVNGIAATLAVGGIFYAVWLIKKRQMSRHLVVKYLGEVMSEEKRDEYEKAWLADKILDILGEAQYTRKLSKKRARYWAIRFGRELGLVDLIPRRESDHPVAIKRRVMRNINKMRAEMRKILPKLPGPRPPERPSNKTMAPFDSDFIKSLKRVA